MESQFILLQVSLEADLGNEPGYISVRGVHVVPGYCHPLPPNANKGAVLFSLGHVLKNPDSFKITFFFCRKSAFCPQETTYAYQNRILLKPRHRECRGPVQTNPGNKICGFKYVKISCGRPAVGTSRLMGICRWRGSHFRDWVYYNGVPFLQQRFFR